MYRLKVNFGRKVVIGMQTYNTIEEAEVAKQKLITLGKAANKRNKISIVDKLGAPIK